MAKAKPLIGITGPRRGSVGPRFCIALALRLLGARPVQLRPGSAIPARELAGVVISGGHDVEPVLYKSAAEVEGNYDPERDAFESEMIDQALAASRPLLGICRGAQLLNVCLGGNLHQNLRKAHPHTRRRRSILPVNSVTLEPDSKLRKLLKRKRLRVNRLHNQSVNRTGVGLRIAARDDNDIVQAIEGPKQAFAIGVQWHPEFLLYQPTSLKLFAGLIAAARKHRDVPTQ